MPGLFAQRGQAVGHQQAARPDDGNPVGDPFHLGQDVRGQHHRRPGRHAFPQDRVELLLNQRVQAAGRLIQQQQFRVAEQRQQYSGLLPVAFGQLTHRAVQIHVQPLGQVHGSQVRVQAPQPRQVGGDRPGAHPWPQTYVTGQVPGPGVDRDTVPPAVQAVHPRRTRGRPQIAHQQPQRRGLPRAVRPEETQHLPGPHVQAEPVECQHPPVTLTQRFSLDHDLAITHPDHHRFPRVHGAAIARQARKSRCAGPDVPATPARATSWTSPWTGP